MAYAKPIPDEIREFLSYDPLTGIFIWLKRPSARTFAGDRAGCLNGKGYRVISFRKVTYYASRLAWFFGHGQSPETDVDHIDRSHGNDRIKNLRLATKAQNNMNVRRKSRRKYKGAWLEGTRWRAAIGFQSKAIQLGSFDTAEEAATAYDVAALKYYGEFAHLNFGSNRHV